MDLLASYDDDGDKSQSSSTNKQDQVRFFHSVNGILYTSTSYLIIKNQPRLYAQNGGFDYFSESGSKQRIEMKTKQIKL